MTLPIPCSFALVLEDCEFAYGDLRDATQEPVEDLTNRVESFFASLQRNHGYGWAD